MASAGVVTDQVVIELQAKMDKFNRDTRKAANDFDKATDQIIDDATKADNAVNAMGGKAAAGIKKTSIATGNLAAQFNDIGVQLAGGQSPFLIALQQGTQVNQALGGAGLRATVAALGGAFTSMLNPVSLATLAIIALGGTAIQALSGLFASSEETNASLEKHASVVRQIADEYGELLPEVKAYADELDRQQQIADRNEAISTTQAFNMQKLAEAVQKAQDEFSGLGNSILLLNNASLGAGLKLQQDIEELAEAQENLQKKLEDGTAAAEDYKRVADAAAEVLRNEMVAANKELADSLDTITTKAGQASKALSTLALNRAVAEAQEKGNVQLSPLDPLGFIDPIRDQNRRATATKSQFERDQEKLNRGSSGSGSSRDREAEKIQREKDAVVELIAQLQFEQSLLTKTDREREIAVELRQAGAAATAEQKEQIRQIVGATYDWIEANKQNEEAMRELNQIGRAAVGTFVRDLLSGKDAADALADALGRVSDMLLNMALDDLFGGGGKDGGLIGGFLSNIFGGFRAKGGPVSSGRAYVVGEEGPELFVPPGNGSIIPNGRGEIYNVNMSTHIDGRGSDSAGYARMQQQLDQLKRDQPAIVIDTLRKARKKNVKGI